MLIHVPSKKHILVLEWKAIQIDFLDIPVPVGVTTSWEEKAKQLSCISDASAVLDLKFANHDLRRPGQTIRNWVSSVPCKGCDKSPREQLAGYLDSNEIKQLRKENEVTGYLIVVVGSRQILFWEIGPE